VPYHQIVFGVALVLCLVVLAVVAAWRQFRLLREVASDQSEEGRYLRGRARRRVVCSVLMFLLAALLGGALLFLEERAQRLADEIDEAERLAAEVGADVDVLNDPVNKRFAKVYGYYYLGLLLVLFALISVAGWDYWVVRRHGLEQFRRLQEERRAAIDHHRARLRSE